MKLTDLYDFVRSSDVSLNERNSRRSNIATLGLVSEIGSVISALKKDLLLDTSIDHIGDRLIIRGQLKEEIGDALWYAVMLAQCQDDEVANDIFRAGIERLRFHLTSTGRDYRRTQELLGEEKREEFLAASEQFLKSDPTLDEYQRVAYITRRTEERVLKDVCSAVLQQLAAQLSRDLLPNSELILNHEVRPKDPVKALGEILWHLSALASLYGLKLSECVALAEAKAEFRNPTNIPGPDHLTTGTLSERFPEKFEVHFVSDARSRSNMYLVEANIVKKKLGASLTDNDHEGDGYRFHDVMHIAFATHLRWSPNLRAFMGLQRRSDKRLDEVEDGGRAKIVEEAVILEVHLQAEAFQEYLDEKKLETKGSPYAYSSAINFEFLRRLRAITKGHEVYDNPQQDWEAAIKEGYDCYCQLNAADGGIIEVDIAKRKISFRPFEGKMLDYASVAM